jgi:Amt family ammonium transporter
VDTLTLKARLHDKERQKFFVTYLAGKMLGLALAGLAVYAFGPWFMAKVVHADAPGAADITTDQVVSATNTAWVLVTAFLVFFMQAGFMMLEAGFARTREVVNILVECIVDTCLCALLFWAFGFAFMFGRGNGFIGHEFFFLNNAPATYTLTGATGVAFMAFFLFQFAFADTCSTITSGAMVGRTGFVGDLIYSIGVSGFIYPIFGHWVWGPGGLISTIAKDGSAATSWFTLHDFAGSTVVHTMGGFIALAGAIVLGPRLGRKFKRDGGGLPPGHDLTIAAVGGVILWFGWYGFNPGSTLSAIDSGGIGRVATNTTLAAAAAGLTSMFFVYPRLKKWDLGISINGFLGGLVAITCPCYWVNATGAVIIGAVAGVVVVLGIDFIEWLRIDDPIGAVAVHGFAGIWGTWSLGLFATGQYGTPKGLLWNSGFKSDSWKFLLAQMGGNAIIAVGSFGVAYAIMIVVKKVKLLRLSEEGELEGIDIHEHGSPAYHPESAYMGKGL